MKLDMKRRGGLALLSVVILTAPPAAQAAPAQQNQRSTDEQAADARRGQVAVTGRVVEVHARGLFTIREADGGREMLVLAPRPFSPGFKGATVKVEGTLRRFDAAQLRQNAAWKELDEGTRARFSGRTVLVVTSVMATMPTERTQPEAPQPAEEPAGVQPAPSPLPHGNTPAPLTVRAAMLVADIEELAGQQVRILNARVVGLLQPGAFLVEPATRYLKAMGTRDRIVVLVPDGALRVPADLVVGSIVTVEGTARSVVGVQVTSEVPWPSQLRPEVIDRLEVRAAVLARSVQTPEGTELTNRRTTAMHR